jgi:hypothetical protein
MPLPFIIDNQQHRRLADALNDLELICFKHVTG